MGIQHKPSIKVSNFLRAMFQLSIPKGEVVPKLFKYLMENAEQNQTCSHAELAGECELKVKLGLLSKHDNVRHNPLRMIICFLIFYSIQRTGFHKKKLPREKNSKREVYRYGLFLPLASS